MPTNSSVRKLLQAPNKPSPVGGFGSLVRAFQALRLARTALPALVGIVVQPIQVGLSWSSIAGTRCVVLAQNNSKLSAQWCLICRLSSSHKVSVAQNRINARNIQQGAGTPAIFQDRSSLTGSGTVIYYGAVTQPPGERCTAAAVTLTRCSPAFETQELLATSRNIRPHLQRAVCALTILYLGKAARSLSLINGPHH